MFMFCIFILYHQFARNNKFNNHVLKNSLIILIMNNTPITLHSMDRLQCVGNVAKVGNQGRNTEL
jgi:ribonuclease D